MNLALFDFDGTLTKVDTFTAFIKQTTPMTRYALGLIRLMPKIFLYKLGKYKGTFMRQDIVEVALKRRSQEELMQKGREFVPFMDSVLRPDIYQKLLDHKAKGDRVLIVSASLDLYLKPWCQKHGVELICSEVKFQKEVCLGVYSSEDCSGPYKLKKVLEKLAPRDYTKIFAYGDTPEDFELLSIADYKFYRGKKFKNS